MAIVLALNYKQTDFANRTIYLEDVTGVDFTGNPGVTGYGASTASENPSKLLADVEIDGWELTITRPDSSDLAFTDAAINALQFDVLTQIVEIPIVDTQDIINGEWTFQLDVNESGGPLDTITITQYIYDLTALETLIFAKFASEVDFCEYPDCACNKGLLVIWTYYMALKSAIEEQNTVQADYLSTVLTTLLS